MKRNNVYDNIYYVSMISLLMSESTQISLGGYTLRYNMHPTTLEKDGINEKCLALTAAIIKNPDETLEWKETYYKAYDYSDGLTDEEIMADLLSSSIDTKADLVMRPSFRGVEKPYWRQRKPYIYEDIEQDGYRHITFILFPSIPRYVSYNVKALAQGYLGELSHTILNGPLRNKVYEKEA